MERVIACFPKGSIDVTPHICVRDQQNRKIQLIRRGIAFEKLDDVMESIKLSVGNIPGYYSFVNVTDTQVDFYWAPSVKASL
jgi:hypothetical protein